ncbi:MAG: 50S ribosomal protein L9 [Patescibacteria group bacterium]
MKVVLSATVPQLGERGDVRHVADGYARNFLFPQKLAELATPAALWRAEQERTAVRKRAEHELNDLQRIATQLDGYELETEAPVSEAGTLYASVGAQKVAQLLKERGMPVKKTQVAMEPIKTPGEYKAGIRFAHGLEAEITIIVTAAP